VEFLFIFNGSFTVFFFERICSHTVKNGAEIRAVGLLFVALVS
jgi:hypothetical protein